MLTIQQTDILALLADFKCLRYSHIARYMAARHNSSDEQLAKMLNQLRFLGKVRTDGEYVSLPGREMKIDDGIIKAFDVMMSLTDGRVDFISRGKHPFVLMFSTRTENGPPSSGGILGVINVPPIGEYSLLGYLDSIDREITVIFILSEAEQRKLIKTDGKHYFAIQNAKGKYKFFKSANKLKR